MIFSTSKRSRQGFTLAELLVAMAITVILVSLVVVITGNALDAWRGARNEIRAARQAKIMLDAMGRDLESMVVRSNNNFEWLNVQSDSREIGPEGKSSPNAASLIFLTAASDRYDGNLGQEGEDSGGDISAVGYTLEFVDPIFDDQDERKASFVLYRNLVNPDQTFQTLLGKEDLEEEYSGTGGGVPQSRNFMCENIYEISVIFTVEYNDTDGELKRIMVPLLAGSGANAAKEFSITGNGLRVNGQVPQYGSGSVIAANLSITVLSDTGVRLMRQLPLTDPEEQAKFFAENSYHYTKTVRLPQL